MTAGFNDRAGSEMRVSDAEREAMAAELREHYTAGRLTREELDDRLDRVFAARTRGDLSALMHDLPGLRPGTTPLPAGQPTPGSGWGGSTGWGGPGWSGGTGWGTGAGNRGAWGPGRTVGSVISALVAVSLLATFGLLAAFGGIGGGRPLAIGLIIAAVALLRRLIFGRRVRAHRGGCGRRR